MSVGQLVSSQSSSRAFMTRGAHRIKVADLCASGIILARIKHPASGKTLVFRNAERSLRDDKFRMFEVVDSQTDGMVCRRAWNSEAELRRTLAHYLEHGFIDVTTWHDRAFGWWTAERPHPLK